MYPLPNALMERIHYHAKQSAQRTALAGGEQTISYADLIEHIAQRRQRLRDVNARRVALALDNGLERAHFILPAVATLLAELQQRWVEIRYTAYTSLGALYLGALYYQVPGWPIGFGDEAKAEWHLQRALAINPEGIDSLYFWGDYLHEQGRDAEAQQVLEDASMAPQREGRELADDGRRGDIHQLMSELE